MQPRALLIMRTFQKVISISELVLIKSTEIADEIRVAHLTNG